MVGIGLLAPFLMIVIWSTFFIAPLVVAHLKVLPDFQLFTWGGSIIMITPVIFCHFDYSHKQVENVRFGSDSSCKSILLVGLTT